MIYGIMGSKQLLEKCLYTSPICPIINWSSNYREIKDDRIYVLVSLLGIKLMRCPKPGKLTISNRIFNATILGGTFDHLHIAHKGLISLTLDLTKQAHICIMSDEWIKSKKFVKGIEDFNTRINNVKKYVENIGLLEKTIFCKIDDPYSYALTGPYSKKVDSIVISQEDIVLKRTKELNEKRKELGLEPLKIVTMPIMRDLRHKVISSTRIRSGDLKPQFNKIRYEITSDLRKDLKTPKGEFYEKIEDLPKPSNCVITVGDIVTESLIESGYPISIGIIDRRSRRQDLTNISFYLEKQSNEYHAPIFIPAINPQGQITYDSFLAIQLALSQDYPSIIRVYGEEDLIGFPATILAPPGSYVIYGDPFRGGLVVIEVDGEVRERAIETLKKMKMIVES